MKKPFKKILITLSAFVICMMMVMSSSCSYIIYSIYMSNYEKKLIEEELKRREEQDNQGGGEAIVREVYYNEVSSGEISGYKMFTLVDSVTYTIDSYEYTTPAGGNAYSSKIFHMQGNYTREGNIVTVEPGISMYAYTTTSSSTQEFYPGETADERKSIYESFMGGAEYNIALQSDGTFKAGGASDSKEAVTGVNGAKVYRWYDDSSRITIKTIAIFEDNSYVLTAFSTRSTNHEQPVSSFIANGTLSYDESNSTEDYNIIKINDATGMCYVSNNGSLMWNDCIADALNANWWDLSVSARSFYVTDNGFTYTHGLISEEIPAGGLYGYEDSSSGGEEEPKPEKLVTLQGDKNPAIELTLYEDGTADFTFTTYNSTTSGTWSYLHGEFVFKGTAVNMDGESVEFENVSKINSDGSIVIAIDTKNGMTQDFTLTAEQVSEIFGGKSIFIEGNSDNGSLITLTLYEDNTFLFHFGAHGANNNETGTYTYGNGELVLITGTGFEAVRTSISGDEVTFTYKAFGGQATQEYTLSVSALEELVGKKSIFMEGNSDNGSLITLTLYEDNTFLFHFGAHGANNNETGTYTYENGELVLITSTGFEAVRTSVSGDEVTFTYKAFGGQATQEYTLSVSELRELIGIKSLFMEGNSDNGSLITLTLYEDNTFLFHFGAHGANNNETGTYTYENGELVLITSTGFEAVRTSVSGDEVTFTYKAFGGQATQEYTLSVSELRDVIGVPSLFIEGNSGNGSLITLTMYGDNAYVFHFAAYNNDISECGTWTYDNNVLVLTVGEKETGRCVFENGESTFKYTYSLSSQLTQEYTISSADLDLLK